MDRRDNYFSGQIAVFMKSADAEGVMFTSRLHTAAASLALGCWPKPKDTSSIHAEG